MARQKFLSIGEEEYPYHMQKFKLEELDDLDVSGPPPDRDFLETIRQFGIIYPIVMTEWDGDLWLIDGRRRVKAARALELPEIVAAVYEEINPFNRAVWSSLLNSQRSENPVSEYKFLTKLRDTDLDAFIDASRGDRAHLQKVLSLDNISDALRETFISSYETGKIAESTLFSIAKLAPVRQEYVGTILKDKGKVTAKDVAHARKASTIATLASNESLFGDIDIPEVSEENQGPMFCLFSDNEGLSGPWYDWHEAHETKLERGNGWKVYRLVEV